MRFLEKVNLILKKRKEEKVPLLNFMISFTITTFTKDINSTENYQQEIPKFYLKPFK